MLLVLLNRDFNGRHGRHHFTFERIHDEIDRCSFQESDGPRVHQLKAQSSEIKTAVDVYKDPKWAKQKERAGLRVGHIPSTKQRINCRCHFEINFGRG